MAEKRKRGENFTSDEKDILLKLLAKHKNTILNKKTDGATNKAKSLAWITVTNLFNTKGRINRSKHSLMKMWEKLKRDSKIYYTATRRESVQTGSGSSTFKIDPIMEQVCAFLSRGCTRKTGVPDRDSTVGHSSILQEVRPNINLEIDEVSSLVHSFQEVNKKKEGIEELKRKLLEEEIKFKQKLYELQLQAATKEVEIKNEVLQQLRSGNLSSQNLFGMQQNKSEL